VKTLVTSVVELKYELESASAFLTRTAASFAAKAHGHETFTLEHLHSYILEWQAVWISFRKGVITLARGKLMYTNNAAHVLIAEALRSKVISRDR
jgi:hypothetical protein